MMGFSFEFAGHGPEAVGAAMATSRPVRRNTSSIILTGDVWSRVLVRVIVGLGGLVVEVNTRTNTRKRDAMQLGVKNLKHIYNIFVITGQPNQQANGNFVP